MNKEELMGTLSMINEEVINKCQYEKAANLLEKMLLEHPRSPETHQMLGIVYWKMKQYDNALDRFIDALLIEPNQLLFKLQFYWIVIFYGKEEYGKKLEEAIELSPKCIFLYYAIGFFLRRKNRYREAIQFYTKGIKILPNTVEFYYFRADAYARIGRIDNAISDYEVGLKLDPNTSKNYKYYFDLAGLYLENKNFNRSLIHLNNLFQNAKPDMPKNFETFYYTRSKEVYKYFEICKNHLTYYPEDQAAELCYNLIATILKIMKRDSEEEQVIEKETCH